MGMVYLAEQHEPVRRQVALKVLRAGTGTAEIVARFRSEQQMLATMEHPNITRVYDAGVTDAGLPYFAMEYVVGDTITEYAATHRLSIRERVQIFVHVCRAIQHAHQKGVIHRDIKPSNVLVTDNDGEPVCKVIDFGIAKAVTPALGSERLTMTGMAIGTPAYMSPEQFMTDGTDVDTRADIYALGAVFYELVSGVLPYDPARYPGFAALLAQHVTRDAPAPSAQYGTLPHERKALIAAERRTDAATLRSTLAGDLDCVALEALERDRELRYPTANAFAEDLENYLGDRPVVAHTSSVSYRARKFVRRHTAGVAFAAAMVVLLVASAVGATIQAGRLARARAVAVARQDQAEELIGFMLGDLRDRLSVMGRLDLLDAVGNRALAYFAAVPASQLSDEESYRRAEALQQLGEVRMAQGKLPAAADLMRRSLVIATGLAARDSLNGRWQIGLAHSHFWAGNVDWGLGEVDSALSHFLPFVTISRRLIAHYPDSLAYREELAYALNNIGFAKEARGDINGALASYRAAIVINQDLMRRDSTKLDWRVSLANEYNAAAVVQRKIGNLSGALGEHDQELALKDALLARDAINTDYQRNVGIAHAYRGELRMLLGDEEGALDDARRARAIYSALAGRDTSNAQVARALAKSDRQVAQVLLERGDAAGALNDLDVGEAIATRLHVRSPRDPSVASEIVLNGTARARTLLAMGRVSDAVTAARVSAARAETAVTGGATDIEHRRAAGDAYVALGEALSRGGDDSGARDAWSRALLAVGPVVNVGRQTEVLAVQAAALLYLRRLTEADPIVAELTRRGYRRPTFVRLVRARRAA
jgi:tetratricopeptide (TPR) repeat protein